MGSTLGFEAGRSLYGTMGSAAVGPGIVLGESGVMHVGLLAESGYDSSVFFTKGSADSSPMLRLTPSIELTNRPRGGGRAPGGLLLSLTASAQYREYFAEDPFIREQRSLSPALTGNLSYSPSRTLGFDLSDQFVRIEEAPYVRSQESLHRIHNLAFAQLRLVPGGGRFQSLLRYTNTLSVYEDQGLRFGSNMLHELMLDLSWRWLPKTAIFAQVAQGYLVYLNEAEATALQKSNAFPFRAIGGLRGLLTQKVSVLLSAGYATGRYDEGSSPRTLMVGADINYRPTPFSNLLLGYRREFRNSPIVGSYYYVDTPFAIVSQMIGSRLLVNLDARYEYRQFEGILRRGARLSRNDHFWTVGAAADFIIRPWLHVGAGYTLQLNESNAEGSALDITGPEYAKHQILGRVALNY